MRREIGTISLMDLTEVTGFPTGDRRMTFRWDKTMKDLLEMKEDMMRRKMIGNVKIAIASSQGIRKDKSRIRILKVTANLRTDAS